jgi:hypothetical protein
MCQDIVELMLGQVTGVTACAGSRRLDLRSGAAGGVSSTSGWGLETDHSTGVCLGLVADTESSSLSPMDLCTHLH